MVKLRLFVSGFYCCAVTRIVSAAMPRRVVYFPAGSPYFPLVIPVVICLRSQLALSVSLCVLAAYVLVMFKPFKQ